MTSSRGEQAFSIYRMHRATPRARRRNTRNVAALAIVGRHLHMMDEDADHEEFQTIAASLNRQPRAAETSAARAERLSGYRHQVARSYRPRMERGNFNATGIVNQLAFQSDFLNYRRLNSRR